MKRILTLIFILFVCLSGKAQEVEISGSRKAVRTSGDVLAFVTPVASLTTVLVLQDLERIEARRFGRSFYYRYDIRPEISDQERATGR